MKRLLPALAAALGLLVLPIDDASAGGYYRGGHYRGGYYGPRVGVGVYFGAPVYRPYWGPYGGGYWGGYWGPRYWGPPVYAYPPPVYYPAPTVVVPASPPVYVERQDVPQSTEAPAQSAPQQWWYWCPGANGYYPYVKECPGGWQRVEPQAPPPS